MTKGGQEMTVREFTKKVNDGELDWDAIIPNGDFECITEAGRLALSGGSDDTR